MNIAVIGTGYVGLVTGACFSELGVDVTCVDIDETKVTALQSGQCPIYEKGLPELLKRNTELNRLKFTSSLSCAICEADALFVCVNTPSNESDASADLTDVFHVIEDLAALIDRYQVIVVKSTVPVGTGRKIYEMLSSRLAPELFDVTSNPEFLSEGTSVFDFMNPARIVIGAESEKAKDVLRQLYLPFILQDVPIVYSNLETAEMIKYASNAFLATKITFINEIADLCERTGVDVRDLADGIGLDKRIGTDHLRPGPGFGGLCFPKDTTALVQTAKNAGSPVRIIETVVDINVQRKTRMAKRIQEVLGGDANGKSIAVLGLTFKPGTDDLRDSPSVAIIRELKNLGANIRTHDPLGMSNAKNTICDIVYCEDIYKLVENCDVLVVATAWPQYATIDMDRIGKAMKSKTLVDLHNMFDANEMRNLGFYYRGIGQGHVDN